MPTGRRPRALRGSLVEVDRSALPSLEEGEYYHADLVGLPCIDRDGRPVGTVIAVENFGAGDLLEIELSDGRKSLIPFRDGIAELESDQVVDRPRISGLAVSIAARSFAQIVADGRRGDATFAHCMADLVEADHHVTRRIKARRRSFADGQSTPMQPRSLRRAPTCSASWVCVSEPSAG